MTTIELGRNVSLLSLPSVDIQLESHDNQAAVTHDILSKISYLDRPLFAPDFQYLFTDVNGQTEYPTPANPHEKMPAKNYLDGAYGAMTGKGRVESVYEHLPKPEILPDGRVVATSIHPGVIDGLNNVEFVGLHYYANMQAFEAGQENRSHVNWFARKATAKIPENKPRRTDQGNIWQGFFHASSEHDTSKIY